MGDRGSPDAYYISVLDYLSQKYRDVIIDQKRWNRSNRITQLFVVAPDYAKEVFSALKRTLFGQDVRLLQGDDITRVYVYIKKDRQCSYKSP